MGPARFVSISDAVSAQSSGCPRSVMNRWMPARGRWGGSWWGARWGEAGSLLDGRGEGGRPSRSCATAWGRCRGAGARGARRALRGARGPAKCRRLGRSAPARAARPRPAPRWPATDGAAAREGGLGPTRVVDEHVAVGVLRRDPLEQRLAPLGAAHVGGPGHDGRVLGRQVGQQRLAAPDGDDAAAGGQEAARRRRGGAAGGARCLRAGRRALQRPSRCTGGARGSFWAAHRSARARPMPEVAPVMRTVLPARVSMAAGAGPGGGGMHAQRA